MYENLSLIYDSYMENVDYKGWADYLVKLINRDNIKSKTVLEYGCGSGNLTLPLSNEFQIIGVDLSDEMLTLAESKLRGTNTRLFKGDLKEFRFNSKVDVVILACDTLNLLNYKEITQFFNKVYGELEPGGLFLFDILSKEYLQEYIASNNFIFEDQDIYFTWTSESSTDYIESFFTFFIKEGDLYRRVDDCQKQYILRENLLTDLLEKVGFVNIRVFNFRTTDPVTNNSDRIQFIAKKPEV